jgi:hypothetical protein
LKALLILYKLRGLVGDQKVVAGCIGKYDKNLINVPPQFISLGRNKEASKKKTAKFDEKRTYLI